MCLCVVITVTVNAVGSYAKELFLFSLCALSQVHGQSCILEKLQVTEVGERAL